MMIAGRPLVSVIVPAYNAAATIGIALDTALAQTWPDVEVIVVDDGSTDETTSVVAERAARDDRIRLLRRPNGGVSAARNTALAAAVGAWIAPLDADDVWRPDKIERQVALAERTGADCIYCWYVRIDEAGHALFDRVGGGRFQGDVRAELVLGNFVGPGSSPLLRRQAVVAIGGWNERLRGNEDQDLYLRLAEHGRFDYVPEVLVGYRQRAGSLSRDRRMMWRAHADMLADLRRRRPDVSTALLRRARANFAWYLAFQAARAGAADETAGHLARLLINRPGFLFHRALRQAAFGALSRGSDATRKDGSDGPVDFQIAARDLGGPEAADGPDAVGRRPRPAFADGASRRR
jgi:glycosyltransferase involved in cell wall biosynthesis